MINLILLIICTLAEGVMFGLGIAQGGPVVYLVITGFFVVLLGYATLQVLIDVLQEWDERVHKEV